MYVQLLVFVLLVVRLVPVAVVIVAKAALEADLGGIEAGGLFLFGLGSYVDIA